MKYYIKTDFDENPVALFRFENTPEKFAQEVWLPQDKKWIPSETLPDMLINGEVFLFDTTPETAQKLYPAAFAGDATLANGNSPIPN
jgi:hypothetical protein